MFLKKLISASVDRDFSCVVNVLWLSGFLYNYKTIVYSVIFKNGVTVKCHSMLYLFYESDLII